MDAEGKISYAEAVTIRYLNVSDKSISDITGIESFINLDTLVCYFNNLTSLDISNNKSLVSLDCSQNKLTRPDLSHKTALGVINCRANLLTSLDLTNNTGLIDLSDIPPYNIRLFINDMPPLNKLCVWVMLFPPTGLTIDTSGSPNVYFSTDCSRQEFYQMI